MTEQEVVELMRGATSSEDWGKRCEQVKEAHGGSYPGFWFPAVIGSGVHKETAAKWGGDGEIHVLASDPDGTFRRVL